MKLWKTGLLRALVTIGAIVLMTTAAFAVLNYYQGFEADTSGWVVSPPYGAGITRVPSGGGVLGLPSSTGGYHAEIANQPDGYMPLFGMSGYSRYGGSDSVYNGDFYQSIDVYINVNWAVPVPYPTLEGFWIDMTPYHADPNNYGAEHNFRIKALGGSVQVFVDGQGAPITTLTNSGWYTFLMTWRRAPVLTDPVITDMKVYDSGHNLLGLTVVYATSPGGPFASGDLRGNGYVWITVWQNGFAGNLLAIDNQRTGLLPGELSYSCTGFEPPMDQAISVKRHNRVLPLKMVCTDPVGHVLGDANIPPPILQVTKTLPSGAATDPVDVFLSAGQGTDGNEFVFDPASRKWVFNLQTRNFTGSGTYTITAVGGGSDIISPAPIAIFVVQ